MEKKFVRKCPKCGRDIQTKHVKRSIGLGIVDIPVSQSCTNPLCGWSQVLSVMKRSDEIIDDNRQARVPLPIKKPFLSTKYIATFGGIVAIIIFIFLLNSMHISAQSRYPITENNTSVANQVNQVQVTQAPQQTPTSTTSNSATVTDTTPLNTPIASSNSAAIAQVITTPTPTSTSTPTPVATSNSAINSKKKYFVIFEVEHGFRPNNLEINRTDTVVWISEENQRTRIALINKENLFPNKVMEFTDKYPLQFNETGNYSFLLAEYPSLIVYPHAVLTIKVK